MMECDSNFESALIPIFPRASFGVTLTLYFLEPACLLFPAALRTHGHFQNLTQQPVRKELLW